MTLPLELPSSLKELRATYEDLNPPLRTFLVRLSSQGLLTFSRGWWAEVHSNIDMKWRDWEEAIARIPQILDMDVSGAKRELYRLDWKFRARVIGPAPVLDLFVHTVAFVSNTVVRFGSTPWLLGKKGNIAKLKACFFWGWTLFLIILMSLGVSVEANFGNSSLQRFDVKRDGLADAIGIPSKVPRDFWCNPWN